MIASYRNTLEWPVHLDGYEWQTPSAPCADGALSPDGKDDDLLLVPRGTHIRTSNPAENRDLFRKFADLGKSRESILDFANVYGRLIEKDRDGEYLAAWQDEIQKVSRVLAAWDFLKGESALTPEVIQQVLSDDAALSTGTTRTSARLRQRMAEVVESAVNPTLSGFERASAPIVRYPSMQPLLSPQLLKWDDEQRLFTRQAQRTSSLLGLIWKQTVEALTGVRDFRKCGYARCSVMIEVSRAAQGHTSRVKFHSNSCRALESRLRSRGNRKKHRKD